MKPPIHSRYRWWVRLPGYPPPWSFKFWAPQWVNSQHQWGTMVLLARHMEIITLYQQGNENDMPGWVRSHAIDCPLCSLDNFGSGEFSATVDVPAWLRDKDVWPGLVTMGRWLKEQDEQQERYADDRT